MFEIIFIVIIILPVAVTFGGIVLKQCAVSDIDNTIGYRTKRSMLSKEAWQFANGMCAKLWITGGIIITVFSVILPLTASFFLNETIGLYIGIFILVSEIISLILSVVTVEKKLQAYNK